MNVDLLSLPARQAALLAHGLPAHDRDWLLDRLEPGPRGVLADLLRELQTLRIPPDHDLLQEVLRQHRPASVLSPTERLERLDAEGVARLVSRLRSEPPGLVIRLLHLHDWPWRAAVARELGVHAADGPDAPADLPPAPALDAALLEAVAAALPASGAAMPPVPPGGRWREIFRRRGRP
ncbi:MULTISPECIES: hypothetical protein [Ramlibacter]|uniref:Uncharacterized protein n=1 Tax=Ramlibacter pinisoli TaxID=2682844 RepID=A0A6N8ISE0_9BURK|nr:MULTISPECIES: hypothetical protein [Ramlibacter]MBA2964783.1 hypothetical protein [Ramlibacter sp. CGMCC 1.13660]MVQ29748.1 hypothetical protein [Ramlibacter pinisoli]